MPAKEEPEVMVRVDEVMVRVEIEDRDLGEIGYAAYRLKAGGVSLACGRTIPEWSALPPSIKKAWAAAGKAIGTTVATRYTVAIGWIPENEE